MFQVSFCRDHKPNDCLSSGAHVYESCWKPSLCAHETTLRMLSIAFMDPLEGNDPRLRRACPVGAAILSEVLISLLRELSKANSAHCARLAFSGSH